MSHTFSAPFCAWYPSCMQAGCVKSTRGTCCATRDVDCGHGNVSASICEPVMATWNASVAALGWVMWLSCVVKLLRGPAGKLPVLLWITECGARDESTSHASGLCWSFLAYLRLCKPRSFLSVILRPIIMVSQILKTPFFGWNGCMRTIIPLQNAILNAPPLS